MKLRQSILLLLSGLFFCFSIPAVAEDSADQVPTEAVQMAAVNINTADAETLAKRLAGVGQKRAAAIIAYRETNGRFHSAEELMSVSGIGKHILRMNEDRIVVE